MADAEVRDAIERDVKARAAMEGIGLGLVAGLLFATVQIVVAAVMEGWALLPVRMAASVATGRGALDTYPAGTMIIAGVLTHFTLSALFGLLYGLVNQRLRADLQIRWETQLAAGVIFGIALWLINFQIIARLFYPWFLAPNQLVQAVLHALCYGLPLGTLYAAVERSVRHIHRTRRARTAAA